MNIFVLTVIGVFVVVFLAALALGTRSPVARVIASLMALGFAAFCAFGFLASFELSPAARWPWQLAYGTFGVSSLVGVVFLLMGIRTRKVTRKRIQ